MATNHGRRTAAAPAPLVSSWGELARTDLGPLRPGMSRPAAEVITRVLPLWRELRRQVDCASMQVVGHGNFVAR